MAAHADPPAASRQPVPVAVAMPITLGQFVKLAGLADTGGAAKQLVVSGGVRVNGQVETRRGHKMLPGDVVEAAGQAVVVVARAEQAYVPGTRPRASIPTRSEPTPPPRG